MIRHIVPFRLKHAEGSTEEQAFLVALRQLKTIPGIEHFDVQKEVSAKNDFTFAAYMAFADQAAYSAYNDHPLHVDFVQNRWIPEVADFIEIDLTAL